MNGLSMVFQSIFVTHEDVNQLIQKVSPRVDLNGKIFVSGFKFGYYASFCMHFEHYKVGRHLFQHMYQCEGINCYLYQRGHEIMYFRTKKEKGPSFISDKELCFSLKIVYSLYLLKGILPDFILRAFLKILKFEFFAFICRFPLKSIVPQRDLAETISF